MKPPDKDPFAVTQAADVTKFAEELENEHVVSVGKNPLPLTETSKPTLPLSGLSVTTGSELIISRTNASAETARRHTKSGATIDLNYAQIVASISHGELLLAMPLTPIPRLSTLLKGLNATIRFK